MKKVGIVGLGTVGAEVARQIQTFHSDDFVISAVCVRDKAKDRGLSLPDSVVWCDAPVDLVDHCDIVIELMGGTGEAVQDLVARTIDQNKILITANKAFLSENLDVIDNKRVRFEAAVAGGIPIIETMRTFVKTNRIESIKGIMNGTCNYILNMLEQGEVTYNNALKQAQDMGFAEADPTLDVSGGDQFQKSLILARMAFGDGPLTTNLIGIDQGIDAMVAKASAENKVVRLISEISYDVDNGVTHVDVRPHVLGKDNMFASIHGANNAIIIQADPVGDIMLVGAGAGAKPTASAVLADLLAI